MKLSSEYIYAYDCDSAGVYYGIYLNTEINHTNFTYLSHINYDCTWNKPVFSCTGSLDGVTCIGKVVDFPEYLV